MNAVDHPLFRRYTFILEASRNQNNPRFKWAQGLELAFDNFWEFAEHIESTIGLPPSPQHKLSRTDQERGWIPGNFCWRTGSELVTANRWGIKIPIRKNSRQRLSTREIAEMFGITYHQTYNRIHIKNYTFQDFKKEFGHARS